MPDPTPPPSNPNAIYLGDGAYAEHEGVQVRLFTQRGGETVEIYLDPGALQLLVNAMRQKGWGIR